MVGANTIIGGNVFIMKPIARDTRVSVKNQEFRYDREGAAFSRFSQYIPRKFILWHHLDLLGL